MLLDNKSAVVYGGGGSIGGAVARDAQPAVDQLAHAVLTRESPPITIAS